MFPSSHLHLLLVGEEVISWVVAKADAESFSAALDCFDPASLISLVEVDLPWGEPGKCAENFERWSLEKSRGLISSIGTYFKGRGVTIVVRFYFCSYCSVRCIARTTTSMISLRRFVSRGISLPKWWLSKRVFFFTECIILTRPVPIGQPPFSPQPRELYSGVFKSVLHFPLHPCGR
jgi:hypothetical protein